MISVQNSLEKTLGTSCRPSSTWNCLVKLFLSTDGCEISFWPRRIVPSVNSALIVTRSLSSHSMHGTTMVSLGNLETRAYKKIAASMDRKNMRAPAKKKLPMDPFTNAKRSLCVFVVTSV